MSELTQEAHKALDFLASAGPYANTTLRSNDLKSLLLYTGGTFMSRGILYNIKSEHLGVGVHKLTIKAAN